jgi:hypothetical protein
MGVAGRKDKESRRSDRQQSPHCLLHLPLKFLRPQLITQGLIGLYLRQHESTE